MNRPAPVAVAVVGPTAVGKSDLAVELALRLGGEVVNADSMQLYRGMDVGTAKLTVAERRGVPHHLLDVLDVTQEASVAAYQRAARAAVADVRARGRVAVLVGGSGLYVSSVLERLDFPGTDVAVRSRLEDELVSEGPVALHARLRALDPKAADAILPTNGRRIVRALEVVEVTGRPFAATLPAPRTGSSGRGDGDDGDGDGASAWVRIGLAAPRDELDRRVAARVDRMWAAGLVAEVRGLVDMGLRQGRTARRALGYAQVLRFLDGELDERTARDATVAATRRFVRRQESWFRRDAAVSWLSYDRPDLAAAVESEVAGATGRWSTGPS